MFRPFSLIYRVEQNIKTSAKNILVIFYLLITSLLSIDLYGQKIAVIEKNNFFSIGVNGTSKSLSYKISIRELFEFKDEAWQPVYNSHDSVTFKKRQVQYVYSDNRNNKNQVSGKRSKQNPKYPLAAELFLVKTPGVSLKKLSPEILHGFEHKDIIAVGIVTDKMVERTSAAAFKKQTITVELKDKVFRILQVKYDSCVYGIDSNYRREITKDQIDSQVLIVKNRFRLGRVNIGSGDFCFLEEGKSYGGGILYFVIYPNEEVKLLVTNLELVDAGDYDNDGNYEYIFIKSSFNNYGYIMYYDDFQQQVVNEWSYH